MEGKRQQVLQSEGMGATQESADHELVSISIDMDPLANYVQEELRRLEPMFHNEIEPTIYKVRPLVRNEDKNAYEPELISIGPYHHNKDSLKPMQHVKWRYLRDLLQRKDSNSLEKYVVKVRGLEEYARRQYSEEIDLTPDEFVQLLVLDGCFILELLLKHHFNETSHYFDRRGKPIILFNDLILVENQIPFFIIQSLFDISGILIDVTLMSVALKYVNFNSGFGKLPNPDTPPSQPQHLLHLHHFCVVQGSRFVRKPRPRIDPFTKLMSYVRSKLGQLLFILLYFLVSIFFMCKLPGRHRGLVYLPSATRLSEAGVQIKKKEKSAGVTPLEISFCADDGTLEIPTMKVKRSTKCRFRNLLYFEQTRPISEGRGLTVYLRFLGTILIKTPADVALLMDKGVIVSTLTNEDVFNFFYRLASGTSASREERTHKLFVDIEEYCEAEEHKWRAELVRDYFSSPWKVLSLVVAALITLMTAIQTIFSIRGGGSGEG